MKFMIGQVEFSLTTSGISANFPVEGKMLTVAFGIPTLEMPTWDFSAQYNGTSIELSIPGEVHGKE